MTICTAVVKAEQEGFLQTEAHRAAHALRTDFEKGGVHLSAEKVDRVNQLNTEIVQLGRQFNENIMIDPGSIDVYPGSRIPKHLHSHLEPIYRHTLPRENLLISAYKKKEKGFRVTTDPSTLSSILRWTADDEVRKRAYIKGNSSPHANLAILEKLICARDELGQTLGCKSYSEFAIQPNMAASPDVVMSFLIDLSMTIRPKADEEFRSIREFKRKMCNEKCADLQPWDEAYFTGKMKSSAYDLDPSVIASYFSLSHCLEGLKVLVKSLFGATFHSMPFAPGESWHPSVMKLSLHHPEEGDLGFLYLDLYSRKEKYPGCAHFAIRGGRRLSGTEYQLPIVALVCNFSASPGSSSRLNHLDVETLFHEFGHALHSLLSRTDYQHFSGTRVVLDLAETPSNLFEHYAWDYRVLRTFARHYATGDVIPEKLVAVMNSARNMFAATELQRQIFLSITDLTLFGEQPSTPIDTISVVADLKRKYTSWNHVDGTHWHTRFTHLITYGAGYYSYLYAKCFSETIWQEICSEDPFSMSTGTAIRTKFLQHGGAKDPVQLLQDFVGSGVVRSSNGGIVPDISSLCKGMGLG
ncbi:probable mitochondrial intermediate peptidase, mitochondrial isoform X2 [Asparagus officinalis]|uniref:probable mitochondrial intermediate peptidase, mitochondrial isoform X2 n=1 Tax=Asparagus officinalis TaxID=4686 RepID=UPI00098E010A|nr:probable mitochondrial intermediate peptidase, mitochondrial isoform X2 [Asparagus officinalis]